MCIFYPYTVNSRYYEIGRVCTELKKKKSKVGESHPSLTNGLDIFSWGQIM